MSGVELYNNYLDKRDFSGSPEDQYAQLLVTIYFNIYNEIFHLLEKAEAENKRLSLDEKGDLELSEYTVEDIILV